MHYLFVRGHSWGHDEASDATKLVEVAGINETGTTLRLELKQNLNKNKNNEFTFCITLSKKSSKHDVLELALVNTKFYINEKQLSLLFAEVLDERREQNPDRVNKWDRRPTKRGKNVVPASTLSTVPSPKLPAPKLLSMSAKIKF